MVPVRRPRHPRPTGRLAAERVWIIARGRAYRRLYSILSGLPTGSPVNINHAVVPFASQSLPNQRTFYF